MNDPLSLKPEPSSADNGTRTQFTPSLGVPATACPPDDLLTAFLEETLPEDNRDRICSHIDQCPDCQDRLDRLTSETDGAVARIKAHPELLQASAPENSLAVTAFEGGAVSDHGPRRLPRVPGFDVLEEIGKGGMGIVYRARHRRLNRLVALKMISAGIHADPRTVQRFFFEAEVMARVRHPQVVEVFEANVFKGSDDVPVPYLAMELLEGGTLRQIIRQGPSSPTQAATLLEGIARAVHAAHLQGIVHRDLKPGNILFGTREHGSAIPTAVAATTPPKVGDFGLAKLLEPLDSEMTVSGQVIGTPAYMAPEQASGDCAIGPEADVYALGTILYEMLVGQPPFQGREAVKVLSRVMHESATSLDRLRPDLPRDLAAVAMKCLEKRPEARYRSAEALADDLRRFLENRPTTARPAGTLERTWRLVRRNPAIASLLTALAAVMLVGIVSVFALWQRAEGKARDEHRAKELAEVAENAAREALRTADAKQARLEFDRGISLCEDGQVDKGLSHVLRSLELAEATNSTDLARVARINLAAWPNVLFSRTRTLKMDSRLRAVAQSQDGSRLVAVGKNGDPALWDVTAGKRIRNYDSKAAKGLEPTFTSLAISQDRKRVAGGTTDGRVWIWETDRDESLTSFSTAEKPSAVACLAFAPDGSLWVADGSNGAKRWDVQSGKLLGEAAGRTLRSPVQTLLVNADGSRVYLGDRGGFVFEWDTTNNRVSRGWPMADAVSAIALNADESALAMTGAGGRCLMIDLTTNRIDHEINLLGAAGVGVAFVGPLLLIADSDGNLRAYHRVTGQAVGVPSRMNGPLAGLLVSPGAKECAVAAGESITFQRPPIPQWQALVTGQGRVASVTFDRPGQRIAVAAGRKAMLFDSVGTPQKSYALPDEPLVLRFDPGHPRLLCGARESWFTIPFDDVPKTAESSASDAPYPALTLVDDSKKLITGNGTGLRCWDSATLKADPKTLPRTLPDGVRALDLRADGTEFLATTGRNLEFLDPATLQPSRPAITLPDVATAAVYSQDGKHLLIGLLNNSAIWLDTGTGKELIPPLTHSRAVTSVAISPDCSVLITGSRDGTARYWDAATGLPLGPMLRHGGPVSTVAWSALGRVATGTTNGHALIWATPPPAGIESLEELRKKSSPR